MRPPGRATNTATRLFTHSTASPISGTDPTGAGINGNRATVSTPRCPVANSHTDARAYATPNPGADRNAPSAG